jgi:hypothetical protein
MKILLACLMCLVLPASQCFAISGGPVFGPSHHAIPGRYAGVFLPFPIIIDPGPPPVTLMDNSLVLFTLKIPKVGLASGTVTIFRNGFVYQGSPEIGGDGAGILGSADFNTGRLNGVVSATVAETGGTAKGRFLNARIKASRISGKASITYSDSGGPILYGVRGFKQAPPG